MLKIAVTPYDIQDDEVRKIVMILDSGWDFVHLRHPGASIRDIKNVIEKIPPRLHRKLRLHGHFELLNEFNLGGIHLNSRCPSKPALYSGSVSRTCHSVSEVLDSASDFDFVTLSPIFDSISKPGYKSGFTKDELRSLPVGKVVALGGVKPERIMELAKLPFVGFAMLGYIFNDSIKSLPGKLLSVYKACGDAVLQRENDTID